MVDRRHAFALHLLEQGTDVRTFNCCLGHRSLATIAKDLRIRPGHIKQTFAFPLSCLPAFRIALAVEAGDYHNPMLLNLEEYSVESAVLRHAAVPGR
jgi:hypothetical protein